MALTDTAPDTETPATAVGETSSEPSSPTTLELVLGSGDHTIIGRIFVLGGLVMVLLGLVDAALIQISVAGNGALPDELVTRLQPNHLLALSLGGLIPLFLGIAISVVPRQVGAASVAFPRAAAASAWTWLVSAVIFVVAVAGNGSYGGSNREFSRMGNVATGAMIVALLLACVCVATTVLTCRPMGMRLGDVPFFSFSMLVASVIWLLSLPTAMAGITLGQITHATPSTLLSKTFGDGLAWLFQQPAMYALCIPILGIALDVVVHLTRGQHRFRGVVLAFIGMYGFLSFGAWAPTSTQRATAVWVLFSILIVLPVMVLFGSLGDTARGGRLTLASPIAFAVLSLFVLLIATLIGVMQAINSTGHGDLANFDLVSVTAGQFYAVAGAATIGALGACFYWATQLFGASLPEGAGKAVAPIAVVGSVLLAGGLFINGIATPDNNGLRAFAGISAGGALILVLAVLGVIGAAVAALFTSRRGDELLSDPWGGGGTLEWAPEGTFESIGSPYPLLDSLEGDA
jgi:heme/copper-type cytochrome/quinol oxidase subunit 1